ncbi:hypothetical protein JCM6882_006552 [Rhodosporidiobolus microsporus]
MLVLPFAAAALSLVQLVSGAPTPVEDAALTIFEEDVTPVDVAHLEKRKTYSCKSTSDCTRAGFPVPSGGKIGCNKARGICVAGCYSGYTLSGSKCYKAGSSSSARSSSSSVSCSSTSQCTNGAFTIPSNGYAGCNKARGKCVWACNSGYTQSGSSCVKKSGASSSNVKLATSSSSNVLSSSGIKSFLGTNTNAIASWFHTNAASDSTNGHSWCYFPYNDNVPGFAISLKTMLADFGGDATAAREAYCGLEAVVTTPEGRSATLVVADAFDDTWVRTPTSMDVVYNAFSKLLGYTTNDKNVVIQNVSWKFNGKRNSQYKYNGVGSG